MFEKERKALLRSIPVREVWNEFFLDKVRGEFSHVKFVEKLMMIQMDQ